MKTKSTMRRTEEVSVLTLSKDGHVWKSGTELVNKGVVEEIKSGKQTLIYKGEPVNVYLSSTNYDGSITYYAILN